MRTGPPAGDSEIALLIDFLCFEESSRIQRLVTKKLVCGPVERIGAGPGRESDHASGRLTVLHLEAARIDREFGNGLERRRGVGDFIRSTGRLVVMANPVPSGVVGP